MVLNRVVKVYHGVSLGVKVLSILVALGGLLSAAVYLNGVQDIRAENVVFEGFANVGADGFDMRFSADVVNPSKIEIPVTSVKYDVVLQDGTLLSRGALEGLIIDPQATTRVEITPRVKWTGSASALAQYLLQDEVLADVNVDAQILPSLPAFTFTKTVDIKPALEQMQNEAIENPTDDIGSIIEDEENDSLVDRILP